MASNAQSAAVGRDRPVGQAVGAPDKPHESVNYRRLWRRLARATFPTKVLHTAPAGGR